MKKYVMQKRIFVKYPKTANSTSWWRFCLRIETVDVDNNLFQGPIVKLSYLEKKKIFQNSIRYQIKALFTRKFCPLQHIVII